MGALAMGAPAMGAPAMGAPAMGAPAMGVSATGAATAAPTAAATAATPPGVGGSNGWAELLSCRPGRCRALELDASRWNQVGAMLELIAQMPPSWVSATHMAWVLPATLALAQLAQAERGGQGGGSGRVLVSAIGLTASLIHVRPVAAAHLLPRKAWRALLHWCHRLPERLQDARERDAFVRHARRLLGALSSAALGDSPSRPITGGLTGGVKALTGADAQRRRAVANDDEQGHSHRRRPFDSAEVTRDGALLAQKRRTVADVAHVCGNGAAATTPTTTTTITTTTTAAALE